MQHCAISACMQVVKAAFMMTENYLFKNIYEQRFLTIF